MSFTLWFMGLPASGKSTLAKRIETYLQDQGLPVENLDGDEIRQNLHPDLGFSREDRATNNRRTAYICKLLNRNGVPVVNAMITPFRSSQKRARDIIEPDSQFVLVYLNCSVSEAADRDPKGLYEQAQAGKVENFTGINHPFQEPHSPDIVVDTESQSVAESTEHVVGRLHELNVLENDPEYDYSFDISQSEENKIKEHLTELGYIDE